jgi:hypothetical protein
MSRTLQEVLGRAQANIEISIYSEDDNKTLIGLWACELNLTMLSKSFQSVNLTENERCPIII